MSPNPSLPGSARSAAEWNEDIRNLWQDPRVRLSPEGRARYEWLLEQWAAAERAEIVEAA